MVPISRRDRTLRASLAVSAGVAALWGAPYISSGILECGRNAPQPVQEPQQLPSSVLVTNSQPIVAPAHWDGTSIDPENPGSSALPPPLLRESLPMTPSLTDTVATSPSALKSPATVPPLKSSSDSESPASKTLPRRSPWEERQLLTRRSAGQPQRLPPVDESPASTTTINGPELTPPESRSRNEDQGFDTQVQDEPQQPEPLHTPTLSQGMPESETTDDDPLNSELTEQRVERTETEGSSLDGHRVRETTENPPKLEAEIVPLTVPPLPPKESEQSRVRLEPPFPDAGSDLEPTVPNSNASTSQRLVSRPQAPARPTTPEFRLNTGMAERADLLARKGMSLTVRGAFYSARAEFIQALRLVAQGLDAETGGTDRSRALANGLRALEEAESFMPRGSQLEADLNLTTLIQAHRTPVLKERDPGELSPLMAMHEYYNYAQEQFGVAFGHEPSASLALFGLGKIETVMGSSGNTQNRSAIPRAIAFHHASLIVDNTNYRAANELGVLLARCGQWEQARDVLQMAARTYPQSEIWHNLAKVHERLGETTLAAQAQNEWKRSQSLPRDGGFGVGGSPEEIVQWMNVRDFVKNSTASPSDMQPITPGRPAGESNPVPAARTAKQPWKSSSGKQMER